MAQGGVPGGFPVFLSSFKESIMISGIGNSSSMSQLFSRLDSKSQGYLEKSDLASAFSAISGGDESAVDDVFAALDGDSDGKVTESEFASSLSKLQEELEAQLSEIGASDSERSSLISDIVSNFEAADADSDGKVSFQEAMAYKDEQQASGGASEQASTQPVASEESQVMMKIMQLMQAYGQPESSASSLLSALA
jgi:Ca2+-binding EF-hand superfamily protein